jgi:hypothetical protein
MTATVTRIEFDTFAYEIAHGRSPKGRGSWIFCPFHQRNAEDRELLMAPAHLNLSQAKVWLRQEVEARRNARLAADLPTAPYNAGVWSVCP